MVVVKDDVAGITVTLGVIVDVGAVEELDWAETESMKEA